MKLLVKLDEPNVGRLQRLKRWSPTLRYCMETEAHVYALAISASVLLSFYPFLTVMIAICRNVLHWPAAVDAIKVALDDYLPGGLFSFLLYGSKGRGSNMPDAGQLTWVSMFLLLFTANGIFEPLEVAFNKIWGVEKNRTYLKNQLVALALIFFSGGLAMLSVAFTSMNQRWIKSWANPPDWIGPWINLVVFKIVALPLSILGIFVVFWLLPNKHIPARHVLRAAVYVAIILEGLKYLNMLVWPRMYAKLGNEYGPFVNSATIVLWSFVCAMITLAGAEWAARHAAKSEETAPELE